MAFLESIKNRWAAFEQRAFPPMPEGRVIAGHNVTLLQSEIGAAIVSCITMNGTLGTRQRIALEKSLGSLDVVLKTLPEGEAKIHFSQLAELGKAVLGNSLSIA